jgi:hypothetical protein
MSNCPLCGALHQGTGLCRACSEEEEGRFWVLANHLRDHPGTTAQGLAKATGLELGLILKFLKQGRFQLIGSAQGAAKLEALPKAKKEPAHRCTSAKPVRIHGRHH